MTITIINLAFDVADVAAICPKGKWIPNLAFSPHIQTTNARNTLHNFFLSFATVTMSDYTDIMS